MISEEVVKQIFFHSDHPRKDALFADEVDILQFARNVEAFVLIGGALKEHARCVEIVSHMNSEVAKALEALRPK